MGSAASASVGESWGIEAGETILSLDPRVMDSDGLWVAATGEAAAAISAEEVMQGLLTLLIDPGSDFVVGIGEDGGAFFGGSIRHAG